MFYFDSATRTIEAQHDRIFFVRLTLEEALFFSIFKSRLLFFCVWLIGLRQLQAEQFRRDAVLYLPNPEQLFFCLYEDQEPQALSDQLILFRIVFTATGVATFFPHVLEGYTDSETTRYRFHGCLRRRYESSDGTLLYSISEVSWQCVQKKHYAVLAFFLLLLTYDWKHIVPFVQAVMCLVLFAFCWIYWIGFGQSLFRNHLSSAPFVSSSQAALFCLVVNIWRPRPLLYTQLGLFWFEFSMWHWQETRQGFDVDVYVRLWK